MKKRGEPRLCRNGDPHCSAVQWSWESPPTALGEPAVTLLVSSGITGVKHLPAGQGQAPFLALRSLNSLPETNCQSHLLTLHSPTKCPPPPHCTAPTPAHGVLPDGGGGAYPLKSIHCSLKDRVCWHPVHFPFVHSDRVLY